MIKFFYTTKLKLMENFYHICTQGLPRADIFYSEEDYIFGMNGIPLFAHIFDVRILAFCLMSNHVHFVVNGKENNCKAFIMNYKRRLSFIADVSSADVCMKAVLTEDYLKRVIAYVLRNPVDAELPGLPYYYKWSSAKAYFNPERHMQGRRFSTLTAREARKILHSHHSLPEDYIIDHSGLIDPKNYVDYKAVEDLFNYIGSFMFYLSRNEKMEMELTSEKLRKSKYTDKELRASVQELCESLFRVHSPDDLSIENRYTLAIRLRKRYGLGPKQLGRLTGADPERLKEVLKDTKKQARKVH